MGALLVVEGLWFISLVSTAMRKQTAQGTPEEKYARKSSQLANMDLYL